MRQDGTTTRALQRVAITAAAALAIGACSTEDVAERVAEEAIEQQVEGEGGGDVDIDLGDGGVRIEGEDGAVEMSFGEDGVSVISTPEGEFRTGTELPDDFPSGVPLPDGMTIISAASMASPDGTTYVVNGSVDRGVSEANDGYADALAAAGFEQLAMTETPDGTFFTFGDDEWDVAGGFSVADGGAAFGINVMPKAP